MTAKRTDANHAEICQTFRDLGCSVFDLSANGSGLPDILIGLCKQNFLVEVKTDTGKLNKKQVKFFDEWRGQRCIVRTITDSVKLVQEIRRNTKSMKFSVRAQSVLFSAE